MGFKSPKIGRPPQVLQASYLTDEGSIYIPRNIQLLLHKADALILPAVENTEQLCADPRTACCQSRLLTSSHQEHKLFVCSDTREFMGKKGGIAQNKVQCFPQ